MGISGGARESEMPGDVDDRGRRAAEHDVSRRSIEAIAARVGMKLPPQAAEATGGGEKG